VLATLFIVRQTGIKRLMAYSSVEHIGVQALGLGFGGPLGIAGALYHMLNHSLNKSLMFFGAGNAMRAYETKEILKIRNVLKVSPVTGTLWLLGAVGIAGAPPSLCSSVNSPSFGLGSPDATAGRPSSSPSS